jgi:hypothetical protein
MIAPRRGKADLSMSAAQADVEATIESSVTWLYIASVKLISRRLAAV